MRISNIFKRKIKFKNISYRPKPNSKKRIENKITIRRGKLFTVAYSDLGKKIFVNQQKIIESYSATTPTYDGDWIVPEGSLFVLGDNRTKSADSREYGFLRSDHVEGKALMCYWHCTK